MPNNLLGDAKVFVANSLIEGGTRFLGSSPNWHLTEGLNAKQLKPKRKAVQFGTFGRFVLFFSFLFVFLACECMGLIFARKFLLRKDLKT